MIARIAILLYGVFCYLVFFATFLYAIAFLGDFGVPKAIDSGAQGPLWQALAINAALLGLFAVQHSVMARPWFKRTWTRIIPAAAERSTYVLFASLALVLLFWKWQPMGGMVLQLDGEVGRLVAYGIYASGWALLLFATFLIDHFDYSDCDRSICNSAARSIRVCDSAHPCCTATYDIPFTSAGCASFGRPRA